MACHRFSAPSGDIAAIVCTRGRGRRCAYCGGPASQLCDFPVIRGGRETTCDRALCRHCATRLPGDRDLCKEHSPRAGEVPDGASLIPEGAA